MERRFLSAAARPVELRCDGDGTPSKIHGYAARYYRDGDPGTEYELYHGPGYRVVERLLPGCFDRACRDDDVRALFNHDMNLLLGRTASNTLRLTADADGLRYEIDAPDTTYARDLAACLKRGDVTGSSFSFDYLDKSTRDTSGPDGDQIILEVRAVRLYDVGPVTFPAYESTSAGVRSADSDQVRRSAEAVLAQRRNARGKLARARVVALDLSRCGGEGGTPGPCPEAGEKDKEKTDDKEGEKAKEGDRKEEMNKQLEKDVAELQKTDEGREQLAKGKEAAGAVNQVFAAAGVDDAKADVKAARARILESLQGTQE